MKTYTAAQILKAAELGEVSMIDARHIVDCLGDDPTDNAPTPLEIAVKSIRANYAMWQKGEIKDGAFSWHLHNNLLRIEKELK